MDAPVQTHYTTAAPRDNASDATSSASEGHSETSRSAPVKRQAAREPTAKPTTKRTATYYQRKNEIDELEKQVKLLSAKLHEAQQHSLVAAQAKLVNMDPKTLRAVHDDAIERNNRKIASTQAMLSSYHQMLGTMHALVPLTTSIHLPIDATERQKTLVALRDTKLQSALDYMIARTKGLDLGIAQSQKERFDFPDGDVAATGFAVTHFTSGHSLRQVYDAFMYYVQNQEISISEELGVLTIRDNEESHVAYHCGQSRFLSTLPEGVEIEHNAAMFTTFVERTLGENLTITPGYAVGAIDWVDQDDLHPYRSDICARKEMTGAMYMTELPSVLDPQHGRPIIAQTWWYYVRLNAPFRLDDVQRQAARSSIARWHEVADKVMRNRLATVTPMG